MNPVWGELAKVPGPSGATLRAHAVGAAMDAVRHEGIQTLLLPAERVTAAHEAGHAVLHAANGNPPFVVRVWRDPLGHGYSGSCDFAPDAPALDIHAGRRPLEAIGYACTTLAGWGAELLFERDGFRMGSSIDEMVCAGGAITSAAQALGHDAETLFANCIGATLWLLWRESAVVLAVQRHLIREHRVRGPKLAALLRPVRQRDLAARWTATAGVRPAGSRPSRCSILTPDYKSEKSNPWRIGLKMRLSEQMSAPVAFDAAALQSELDASLSDFPDLTWSDSLRRIVGQQTAGLVDERHIAAEVSAAIREQIEEQQP